MDHYRNKEKTRVSRSGRVLKKTLKMKEMEELVIEEDAQEKNRRRFRSSAHRKPYATIHVAHTSAESHSSGFVALSSSSSGISSEGSLYSKNRSINSVISRNLKNSKVFHMAAKSYSSEDDRKSSTDVSSEDESSSVSSSSVSTSWSSGDSAAHSVRRGCTKRNSRWGRGKGNTTLKRETNYLSKKRATNNRSVKRASAARRTPFNSYAKKTGIIEHINKKLIFSELSKRLGIMNLSLPKKEKVICQGKAKQTSSKQSGNSSTNCNGEPMSATAIKQIDPQVKEESLELSVENSTLGIAPIDVAAHLTLLGDSATKIGATVMNLDRIGPGVYACLLDVLLCSLGPLLCLTREIAGLEGLPENVFGKMLDHIAYIIPGL